MAQERNRFVVKDLARISYGLRGAYSTLEITEGNLWCMSISGRETLKLTSGISPTELGTLTSFTATTFDYCFGNVATRASDDSGDGSRVGWHPVIDKLDYQIY